MNKKKKMNDEEKAEARYFNAWLAFTAGIAVLEQAEKDFNGGEWLGELLTDNGAKRRAMLGGFSLPADFNYELDEWPTVQGCTKEQRSEIYRLQEQYRAKFRNFILLVERCYPAYAGKVEGLSISLEGFDSDTDEDNWTSRGGWIFETQWVGVDDVRRQSAAELWKKIEADFRMLFAEIVNSGKANAAGATSPGSIVGKGSRRAKQRPAEVSIYAGKEVPGEGAYIGKRIAVANDGRSITLKNNERASGKRYTYYPRTIPLVDALVNQFANGGGWLESKCLMKKIGKDGKKWQSLIDDKKTLKAAIESEKVNNRATGRIRLKVSAFG